MTDVDQHKIAQFVNKHDLGEEQFLVLVEELGELAELLEADDLGDGVCSMMDRLGDVAENHLRNGNTSDIDWSDVSDEDLAEELADVIYVARSLAEMRDINITPTLNEIAEENLQKDITTDGQKVTKSEVDDDDREAELPIETFTIEDWPSWEFASRTTYVQTDEVPAELDEDGAASEIDIQNVCVDIWGSGKVTIYERGTSPNQRADHYFRTGEEHVPGDPILAANMALVQNDIVEVGTDSEGESGHPWEEDPRLGVIE